MNIFDIARMAGVSRKTVQRVLNGSPSVRPETKARIERIMEDNHYEPSETARNLSARRTRTIAVFIVQNKLQYELHTDDLYFGAVIGGIVNECTAKNYKTLITTLDVSNPEPLLSVYKQRIADAGIIVSWSNVQSIVDRVTDAGFLIGVFDPGNISPHTSPIPYPAFDNRASAREAATYLMDLGHTDLAIVTGDLSNAAAAERLRGFLEAAAERGIAVPESRIHYGQFVEGDGVQAVERWIAAGDLPRALFCSNDLMAYGALKALIKNGIPVPERISILGFDDLLISQYTHPPLTTMRVPRVLMAENLAERMIRMLEESASREGGDPDRRFTAELVERESCRTV
ncbi:substrate-binding domain-containing protein [Cohnella sp. CFH 77786]|uniref:LacI family DNA-binding transcriptional regulator n=1 Tax=Cohnella sp. CFH 77786 TaxID=2662265 RepID=UPI001C6098A2|nr:LacI family DNA-binding transcriptional regulator [Cohnella sp. CFH 77786]MBW5445052.1 substrate-binding domain-containing protein [Cohnella sp. CFH 77786]